MTIAHQSVGSVAAFLKYRGMEVHSSNDAYSSGAVRTYCAFVDEAIDERGYGASLFRVNSEILSASGALVHLIRAENTGAIRAALHTAPDPNAPFTWLNGLVKAEGESSRIVHELVARTLLRVAAKHGDQMRVRACYRIFPEGYRDRDGRSPRENDGSRRLFEYFEFGLHDIETIRIEGNFQDAHLLRNSEPDGQTIRTKVVESSALSLETARQIIGLSRQPKGGF